VSDDVAADAPVDRAVAAELLLGRLRPSRARQRAISACATAVPRRSGRAPARPSVASELRVRRRSGRRRVGRAPPTGGNARPSSPRSTHPNRPAPERADLGRRLGLAQRPMAILRDPGKCPKVLNRRNGRPIIRRMAKRGPKVIKCSSLCTPHLRTFVMGR
jgi:hypothetical protein